MLQHRARDLVDEPGVEYGEAAAEHDHVDIEQVHRRSERSPEVTAGHADAVHDGRITFRGTHDGPLMGIAATHKAVKFDMTWWLDFAQDGRVASWVTDGDVFAMFAQIGAFPTLPMK